MDGLHRYGEDAGVLCMKQHEGSAMSSTCRISDDVRVIQVDERRQRFIRSSLFGLGSAMFGVSMSFVPLGIWGIGREGGEISDWRLWALVIFQFLILLMYAWLAQPVINAVRAKKRAA